MPVANPWSRFTGFKWRAALVAGVLLFGSREASLASTWTNPSIGDWFIAGNWDNGVPDQSSSAIINNNGTGFINSGQAQANYVWVGSYNSLKSQWGGTLQVSRSSGGVGGLVTPEIMLGLVSAETAPGLVKGTLNISDAASVRVTGNNTAFDA